MADRDDFNSMQADVGLLPGNFNPPGPRPPSPGEMSLMLTQQANQRLMQSQQVAQAATGYVSPGAAMSVFAQQYRQQFQMIQNQQGLNPYAAQMLAAAMPGSDQYGSGMMPSPLTMTPPSTGIFRPSPVRPMYSPISPMYVPPAFSTPFTPQMPAPMFQSPYEQYARSQDIAAQRRFAFGAQVPGVLGEAGAIAAGAWGGARLGASFGPMGMAAGALGGAALMGFSGVAGGVGDVFRGAMRPMTETRQMGAALQRSSQNWVVTGSELDPLGRGLSREAGIDLAREIRNLASERTFKRDTGGMFNREDLMSMTQQAGAAGLMDMAQSTPQIKRQLRDVARTVKEFMTLTNDPDVSHVIREMGKLNQFGLTPQQMTQAAQNMRMYSRAAGTTIQGLQDIGGMPGAMTFQQAGMTAGAGFQYGNYAAASARQLVAAGGLAPSQVALLGGVQGIAQRDMQAQAAFNSMPLVGAAMAQWGPGGWQAGAGAGRVGMGGAQGLITSAYQNMSQGVQQGGIGALALLPLQQRMLREQAMANMTPEQQELQRNMLAMKTGQMLGLKGEAAFAFGATQLYGQDVAEQMLVQAKSPGMRKAQLENIQRRRLELAFNQRQKALDDAPMLGGLFQDIGRAVGVEGLRRRTGEVFEEGGATVAGLAGGVSDWWEDSVARTKGVYNIRSRSGGVGDLGTALRTGKIKAEDLTLPGGLGTKMKVDYSGTELARMGMNADPLYGNAGRPVRNSINWVQSYMIPDILPDALTPNIADKVMNAQLGMFTPDQVKAFADKGRELAIFNRDTFNLAHKIGGKRENVLQSANVLSDLVGKPGTGVGYSIIRTAASKLDNLVYARGARGKALDANDYKQVLRESIAEKFPGMSAQEIEQKVNDLEKQPGAIQGVRAQLISFAKKNPKDSSLWGPGGEESANRALMEEIDLADKTRVATMQKDIEPLEEILGVDPWNTIYSGTERKVQKFAKGLGGKKFAIYAAVAAAGKNQTKMDEVAKKFKLTNEELDTAQREVDKLDEGTRERISAMGEKGTVAQLEEYGKKYQGVAVQEAYGVLQPKLQDYSSGGVQKYFAENEVRTAKGIAGAYTKEEVETMIKSDDREVSRIGKLIKDIRGGGEKGVKAEKEFTAEGAKEAPEEGVVGKAIKWAKNLVGIEGKEAEDLDKSEKAIKASDDMFKDFIPAAAEFREGALMLKQAMNANMDNNVFNQRDGH